MPDPTTTPLRILIIGAHPDDAEFKAGGSAALWRAGGHIVKMVSVTDGSAGHHVMPGPMLAQRRRAEAAAAGAVIGAEYEVLPFPDGRLQPTLEVRDAVIRLIRRLRQDAAFIVTVPAVCPDVPHLTENPVFAHLSDHFTRPYPFAPAVAVDITPVVETPADMLACHVSQVYEWLPHNLGFAGEVPADPAARRAWLGGWYRQMVRPLADRHRELVVRTYGPDLGSRIQYIEAFEPGEYGRPLDAAAIKRLFPFVP
jgi:LmbE family N-acetylglucosaminyl deacetylase